MSKLVYKGEEFPVYVAEPEGTVKGGLVVIHEVWGLSEHIKDVADRFAKEGYEVVAPDLVNETDIAKYADNLRLDLFNPETRSEAQPKLRKLMAPLNEPGFAPKTIGRLKVCFEFLYNKPAINHNVAVTGFCFGGSYTFSLAQNEPRLKAAIPFYGHASEDAKDLAKIKCPVLAFYGKEDTALIEALPKLEANMKAAGVDFTPQVYLGAGHAFFNETNPFTYQPKAADDAWRRTLAFLGQTLTV